jgi:Ca2+/Na+ antiporter
MSFLLHIHHFIPFLFLLFFASPCLSFFARTLERDHTIKPWSIYLVEMKGMFLGSSSVEDK